MLSIAVFHLSFSGLSSDCDYYRQAFFAWAAWLNNLPDCRASTCRWCRYLQTGRPHTFRSASHGHPRAAPHCREAYQWLVTTSASYFSDQARWRSHSSPSRSSIRASSACQRNWSGLDEGMESRQSCHNPWWKRCDCWTCSHQWSCRRHRLQRPDGTTQLRPREAFACQLRRGHSACIGSSVPSSGHRLLSGRLWCVAWWLDHWLCKGTPGEDHDKTEHLVLQKLSVARVSDRKS